MNTVIEPDFLREFEASGHQAQYGKTEFFDSYLDDTYQPLNRLHSSDDIDQFTSIAPLLLIDDLHPSTTMNPPIVSSLLSPPDYPSSQRLKWIKQIFHTTKGSRFGFQKRDIAFLLLSNCPIPRELSTLLENEKCLRSILLFSGGKSHLNCHCPHKERMITVLGWEHKRTLNILRAAELFGPAIAYCVPEKQSIVDFFRSRQSTAAELILRGDLQDALFAYLNTYVKSTQLIITAESLISFETSSCFGQDFFSLSGASSLHDLAQEIFTKMGISADQEYLFELFDGRVGISHPSVSSFRCPHQISTCTSFTRLKLFCGAKLKLMYFESSRGGKTSSLTIIYLSIRSVDFYDPYCILN